MKKKSEIVILLDELRSEDPKKRLNSVQSLKDIASSIGHTRTNTQFLQYLTEFIDDQENIVLQLLDQLSDFKVQIGGQEHESLLLPLLISFCKTDQKKQTQKSLKLMQPILARNKDLILDVVKKLSKVEMNTTKYAAAYLITRFVSLVPQYQSQLLQIFSGMISSDIPSYKITVSKFIPKLLNAVKNKEEVGKMLEVIYSDNEDLPKIYALQALVNYYTVNSTMVLNKFKLLLGTNNWRINTKICQIVPLCVKIFTKSHFKFAFQTPLLKFFTSTQPQLKSKSCCILNSLAQTMSQQQINKSLVPLIWKLASDPVDYVKKSLSENIVSLIEIMPTKITNDQLIPIILNFIKNNQLAIGILKGFDILTKKFTSDMIEQKILTPLMNQLTTDNWKVKCQMIELLTGVISNSFFLNDQLTTMLVHLAEDKINAVRQRATKLIINIICQQSPQWCDSMLIPKLTCLKQSSSYIERQIMLQIIEKTCDKVSQKTLIDVYKDSVLNNLSDSVPNVRVKALKVLKNSKRLDDKMFDKVVDKLRSDYDSQVKRLAIQMSVKS